MKNSQMIELMKSVIDTSVGGTLNGTQLDAFITTLKDRSAFMKKMRVEVGIVKSMDLDRLGIDKRILRKKIENTAPEAPTAGVTTGLEQLIPQEAIAYIQLTYKWLKKVIGGSVKMTPEVVTQAEKQVYDLFSKQWFNDSMDLAFNGDKQSATEFLQICDGIVKRAKAHAGTHKCEHTVENTYYQVFRNMLDKLPDDFQENLADLAFIVNPKVKRAYKDELAAKNTALGDMLTVHNLPLFFEDIPIEPLWVVPEDEIILTLPNNLAIGYGEEMLVERDKDIVAQHIKVVATMDIDANIVVPDALVISSKV